MLILKAIQYNCHGSGEVLHAVLETRIKRKVDIVLVQDLQQTGDTSTLNLFFIGLKEE
jgi:hypothetical protein